MLLLDQLDLAPEERMYAEERMSFVEMTGRIFVVTNGVPLMIFR